MKTFLAIVLVLGSVSAVSLDYSTFFGGTASDTVFAIVIDSSGNIFIAGQAASAFPTTAGAFDETTSGNTDAFVAKFNSTGTGLIYSTVLGGGTFEEGNGLAVDDSGNAYVTGQAEGGFPVTAGAYDTSVSAKDVFVTVVNPTGTGLVYSTVIGGGGVDSGHAIAIDSSGNVYVTGEAGNTFPMVNSFNSTFAGGGTIDIFVLKLNPAGGGNSDLIWSTYLGGTGANFDEGNAIVVDDSGNVYVTGLTTDGFFTTAGAFNETHGADALDAFVVKFNSTGNGLEYSTFLGGGGSDSGNGLYVDSSGNAYITGYTGSSDFPTVNAYDDSFNGVLDFFVTKLNSAGSALIYSTYIGR